MDGDYNIRLEENTEIEFDRKGNWFEIKISKSQRLPESVLNLLPKKLNQYIEKNYPEQYIRRIEKKSYGYRVKLNKPNNVELSFTKAGDFQRIESKGSEQSSESAE
ncbi:MAG: PepSY-like domain-containing protein [Paludibacteraceae bacterium]|nr:PepSY-like domain-containing protein [Paludibacteraceae bacterium]